MKIVRPFVLTFCLAAAAEAQQPSNPPIPIHPDAPKPAAITKLSATTFRIGEMTIDTAAGTLSVPGTVNEVTTLEFVANTLNGPKAYESALTLNTNAVSFNAALLLLGLDPARSKPSREQFDPAAPEGDPVEVLLTWNEGGKTRTVPIEELLLDDQKKQTLLKGTVGLHRLALHRRGTAFLSGRTGWRANRLHARAAIDHRQSAR